MAITFAYAGGLADATGQDEHREYFTSRFREQIAKLDADDVADVVGFIAEQAGIEPEPIRDI